MRNFIKVFGLHLVLALLLLTGLFWLVSAVLNGYTRHGQQLKVPDLSGLHINDAIHLLNENKLRFQIIDSVFFEDQPKLGVLEQNPEANSSVKEGRIIYLTINSNKAPQVSLPNLTDVSLRQAEALLLSAGLKVGQLIYKPDIAKDVVLAAQQFNTKLATGNMVSRGSAIDLILGDGLNGEEVPIPNLIGLSLTDASNLLNGSSLNLGSVVSLTPITDSASAKVVKQNPPYAD